MPDSSKPQEAEQPLTVLFNVISRFVLKRMRMYTNKEWLMNDDIVEAYECEVFKDVVSGAKIEISLDGENAIEVLPEAESNDAYIVEAGEYKIKDDGNVLVYVFKHKDGKYTFRVVKA